MKYLYKNMYRLVMVDNFGNNSEFVHHNKKKLISYAENLISLNNYSSFTIHKISF